VNNPLIQLAMTAMLVFGALKFLAKYELGWWLVILLTIVAAFAAVVAYLLRYDRARAQQLYAIPIVGGLIDQLCKLGNMQPPVNGGAEPAPIGAESRSSSSKTENADKSKKPSQPPSELALRTVDDFRIGLSKLTSAVRGHDQACAQIISQLERSILLRSKQENPVQLPPLGAFLIVGSPGIGKRYLSQAVGQLLYTNKATTTIDLKDYPNEDGIQQAFASGEKDGTILAAVKTRPYQAIVIRNIECAGRKDIEVLTNVLGTGFCNDAKSGTPVSFHNCVFLFTTTKHASLLRAIHERSHARETFLSQVRDALVTDTQINEPLLARLSEVLILDDPNPLTKAEVVAMLMEKESRRFNLSLDFVSPEILVEEVNRLNAAHGFSPLPGRISNLLRDPLYEASRKGSKRLILEKPAEPTELSMAASAEFASPAVQRGSY
jgi:hypothetical protein